MIRMIAMWWELRSDLRFRQVEDAGSNPGLESGLSDGKAQFGPPFILDVRVEETAGFRRGFKGSSLIMQGWLTPDNYGGVRMNWVDVLVLWCHLPFQWRGQFDHLLLEFLGIDNSWLSSAWQILWKAGYGLLDRLRQFLRHGPGGGPLVEIPPMGLLHRARSLPSGQIALLPVQTTLDRLGIPLAPFHPTRWRLHHAEDTRLGILLYDAHGDPITDLKSLKI